MKVVKNSKYFGKTEMWNSCTVISHKNILPISLKVFNHISVVTESIYFIPEHSLLLFLTFRSPTIISNSILSF